MKREIFRSATIHQGRTIMTKGEFRHFLNALGYKARKDGIFEIRLESEFYSEDDEDEVYTLNWRVKCE